MVHFSAYRFAHISKYSLQSHSSTFEIRTHRRMSFFGYETTSNLMLDISDVIIDCHSKMTTCIYSPTTVGTKLEQKKPWLASLWQKDDASCALGFDNLAELTPTCMWMGLEPVLRCACDKSRWTSSRERLVQVWDSPYHIISYRFIK